MKIVHNLSQLDWQLAGFVPEQWRFGKLGDIATSGFSDVSAMAATVPGSVQEALRRAGVIPDWNSGLDARQCEWVENRQWVYQARLPAKWLKGAGQVRLRCAGLDYSGWIYVNGQLAGQHIFAKADDWKTPFEIQIDPLIDWKKTEQLVTVRVEDKAGVGGIWRPVWIVSKKQ